MLWTISTRSVYAAKQPLSIAIAIAENEREHQAIALNGLIIMFPRQKRINYETPMHS